MRPTALKFSRLQIMNTEKFRSHRPDHLDREFSLARQFVEICAGKLFDQNPIWPIGKRLVSFAMQ